jgi:hypothetical protein
MALILLGINNRGRVVFLTGAANYCNQYGPLFSHLDETMSEGTAVAISSFALQLLLSFTN